MCASAGASDGYCRTGILCEELTFVAPGGAVPLHELVQCQEGLEVAREVSVILQSVTGCFS